MPRKITRTNTQVVNIPSVFLSVKLVNIDPARNKHSLLNVRPSSEQPLCFLIDYKVDMDKYFSCLWNKKDKPEGLPYYSCSCL